MPSYRTPSLPRWLTYLRPKRYKGAISAILIFLTVSVALRQIGSSLTTAQRQEPGLLFPRAKPASNVNKTVTNGTHNTIGVSRAEYEVEVESLQHESNLTACPNLDAIAALAKDREMNLTQEFSTAQLEGVMCPNQPGRMREVSAEGTRWLLQSRNSSTSGGIASHGSRVEAQCGDYVYLPGGHWRPASCQPRWKVALVVPYRNRTFQLSIFLRYMIPFLQKQRLEFAIYIVNQANDQPFNRGMLLNIGFKEALNLAHWDCFVFHDVDHLPQSEQNPYGCVDLPRHFISGADNRNYKVPYSTSFGGITGFTRAQFQNINGFSNVYWGWCCEDDDLEQRVRSKKLRKTRYKGSVGYYKAIVTNHHKSTVDLSDMQKLNRKSLKASSTRFKTDGLNNLRYKLRHLELATLYTNISVDIQRA